MLLRIQNLCNLQALPLSSPHQTPHFNQLLICQRTSADEQQIPGKNKRKTKSESGSWHAINDLTISEGFKDSDLATCPAPTADTRPKCAGGTGSLEDSRAQAAPCQGCTLHVLKAWF